MSVADSPTYEVQERGDHLEVRGVSRREVLEALRLHAEVQVVRAARVAEVRDNLVQTLMAKNVSLIPPASLAQAQRLAAHRDALLATPAYTHESLQQVRGDARESSTRTWLSRRKDARELFTVKHDGRTIIPAFQLDANAEPRPELQPVLQTLIDAGVQSWALWTWLTAPTSLLSGEIPEQLVRSNPQRVLRAAQRFAAANAA
ncbi:hypothetical protein [Candidatus Mycolicibacterium alkanivorans]|uniref:Antitoxin Xre/MbcA/ParS-like toxin-binding domain-containing protein n=1 Tax=Candidatus Mycolicibacterium alkanivorans TaxID=2954114 RepID=A0ABS9YTA3_9MYCO|nr:hypothetical protein [Candidatus Mycolicibacterium alkanivorans]MCI4674421.1 hypothetical protein [Candidatus Mycolicibacterium alkanivorans]